MQFTKALSIFALAATTVSAAPEPAPQAGGGANGTVSVTGVTDAFAAILTDLVHLSGANAAVVHALIEATLESGSGEAGSAAAAISAILGQNAAFASDLQSILAAITVCVNGHA